MEAKRSTSHRSYYILFTIMAVCLGVLFSDDVLPYVYDWNSRHDIIPRTHLRDKIAPGAVMRLSTLLPDRKGSVCIVAPSTGIVSGMSAIEAERANASLKGGGVAMGKGEWALVYIDGEKVEINSYSRSKYLWLASSHLVERAAFPTDEGFMRQSCALIGDAVFIKAYLPHERLIQFGTIN